VKAQRSNANGVGQFDSAAEARRIGNLRDFLALPALLIVVVPIVNRRRGRARATGAGPAVPVVKRNE
jgi:hypothetical protein